MIYSDQTTTFGQWLKGQREGAGLSLRALEDKLNVAYAYLSEVERGKVIPSERLVLKLADFFKSNPETTLFHARRVKEQLEELQRKYPNLILGIKFSKKAKL